MQYQLLGRTGLFVSRLALGTATFGGADDPVYRNVGGLNQPEADRLVGIALDAGVNLFDSADVYAKGESEQRLGKALGTRRNNVLVSTKIGNRLGTGPNHAGLSRVHIIESVEGSLRRLGTDHIDLLQLHVWDPLASVEDVMRSLNDVVRAGKVRYLGCSNFFAWQVMKAQMVAAELGLEKFVALQAYYSIASRDIEREIVPALLDQGIGLLSWSPLAAGLLSGKFRRDHKPGDPARRLTSSFPPVDEEHAYQVIDALAAVAARHGASVAQIALGWQFRQPALTAAVVGARNEAQLTDNLKSLDVKLTDEDLAQLDRASRLQTEYPRWYHDIPLGRMPGSSSAAGNLDKASIRK